MLYARPLSETTKEAIEILLREIGTVNTVRFLNQFTGGLGNYSEERYALLRNLTLEDIVAGIEEDRANARASGS